MTKDKFVVCTDTRYNLWGIFDAIKGEWVLWLPMREQALYLAKIFNDDDKTNKPGQRRASFALLIGGGA